MNLSSIKKIFHSPISQYVGIRYTTYGIHLINSILIAKYLGVYYFGIYSFLLLVNQYLIFAAMAPAYSLNAILSAKKNNTYIAGELWGNSLLISLLISILTSVTIVIILICFPDLFSKYQFAELSYYLLIIFILVSINNLFINLYRTYGLLTKININQFLIPFSQFVLLFFAREKELLFFLLYGTIIANFLSLILFIYKSPLKIELRFTKIFFSELLLRGFHLLLYNVSYYLILLSSRTVVSIFYSVEQLGYYTLAVNFSNALFMIVGSFSFVLFPKLLNKFHKNNEEESRTLLYNIRSVYITGCFLLTYFGYFMIPFLIYLLPQYRDAVPPMKILLLTQLIVNNNFGYSILLIAKKRERLMTKYALYAVVIIISLSIFFTYLNFNFTTIAIAVLIGFLYYCIHVARIAFFEIKMNASMNNVIRLLFPLYNLIPMLIIILSIIINDNFYTPAFSLIVFSILNKKRIINAIKETYHLITNQNSLIF